MTMNNKDTGEAPERIWLTPQFADAAAVIGGGIYHVNLSEEDRKGCVEYARVDPPAAPDTRAPVDSQGAETRDHYFVPTLIRDSCAKCGKGADRHPGHDQVATQMRTACVEKVKSALADSRRSWSASRATTEYELGGRAAFTSAIAAIETVTLDQVKQENESK